MKQNLDFRPWREDDIDELTRLANDPQVARSLRDGFPYPYSCEDAAAFISMSTGGPVVYNFAVIVDGRLAGGIGYVPGVDVHRISAEIGYWLGREFWGRGIATEAVKRFSGYVFANSDIVHLHAGIFSFNKASQRVLEKAGYRAVGVMNRCAVKDGTIIDLHYYELVKPL